jgi:hypothetical protein
MSGPGDIDGEVSGDEAAWRDLIARFDDPADGTSTGAPWPASENLPEPADSQPQDDHGPAEHGGGPADVGPWRAERGARARPTDSGAGPADRIPGTAEQGAGAGPTDRGVSPADRGAGVWPADNGAGATTADRGVADAGVQDSLGKAATPDSLGKAGTPDSLGKAGTPDSLGKAGTPDSLGRPGQPASPMIGFIIPSDRTRVIRPAGDPRSYTPPEEEDEPYVPVPLPPPAKLDSVTKAALAGVIGGPGYLLVVSIFLHWTISAEAALIAVAAFVAGFVTLIMKLGDRSSHDDDDDGAVL